MVLVPSGPHSYTSPPPNRHHQLDLNDVWPRPCLPMRGASFLKQVSGNSILSRKKPNRYRNLRCFCVSEEKFMASEAPRETLPPESSMEDVEAKEKTEKLPELPPPPEKPLPGDCCGSGCVRCVWDEYYEELEAYNKLYKTDSSSNS